MSDLRSRHRYLERLGIQIWYPREALSEGAFPVVYTWGKTGEDEPDVSLTKRHVAARRVRDVMPVQSMVAAIKQGSADLGSGSEASAAQTKPRLASDVPRRVVEEQACCLGAIRAGEWVFVFESPSETDLAMDLSALGRVVESISGFPGWAPPDEFQLVWPPLPVTWAGVSLEDMLTRFARRLEGKCRSLAFFSVPPGHARAFIDVLGVGDDVHAAFHSVPVILEQREGKRALWQHLKARQG